MKVTPIAEKTLRSLPPQTSQTVRLSSLKAWWMSKALSHSVQR
ncbi:hypothetical protein BJ972_003216 [Agromyces atrinae]|uniref:Uncharacterized protein n=1 Tax=Agromyces atrinae TaxID=592376 RepID=A0A852SLY8_9MICO|nr:hypothetical protein [Agromyces atrinae]